MTQKRTTLIRIYKEDKLFMDSLKQFKTNAEKFKVIRKTSAVTLDSWLGKPVKKRK